MPPAAHPARTQEGDAEEAARAAQQRAAHAAEDAAFASAQGQDGCLAAVADSCLLPFLCFELRTTSFMGAWPCFTCFTRVWHAHHLLPKRVWPSFVSFLGVWHAHHLLP